MASSDRSFQPASFRSRNKALFTSLSRQASNTIRQDDISYHRCIENSDVSLTLGDLVRCNYKAIISGWDLHEKLWKRVDANFSQINKQLRRTHRSSSRSADSSIRVLRNKTKSSKGIHCSEKLIDTQADLITGLEQRLTKLESSNSRGAQHLKLKILFPAGGRGIALMRLNLLVEQNPTMLGIKSRVLQDVSFVDNILFQANPDL